MNHTAISSPNKRKVVGLSVLLCLVLFTVFNLTGSSSATINTGALGKGGSERVKAPPLVFKKPGSQAEDERESSFFGSFSSQAQLLSPYENVLGYLEAKEEKNITDAQLMLYDEHTLLDYNRYAMNTLYPETIDQLYNSTDLGSVDWSKLGYYISVVNETDLCVGMMKLAELSSSGTKADLLMFIDEKLLSGAPANIITEFQKKYNVKVEPLHFAQLNETWIHYPELLAFNRTEYKRLIYVDPVSILTKGNLDELFFIPPTNLAVPSAYWTSEEPLSKVLKHFDLKKTGYIKESPKRRALKLNKIFKSDIEPFLNEDTAKLNFHGFSSSQTLDERVNEKNFYSNLYNSLPKNWVMEELFLSTNVMVIQPGTEVFSRVEKDLLEVGYTGKDLARLLRDTIFSFRYSIRLQIGRSRHFTSRFNLEERLDERPELMILPHNVYGTLASEFEKYETSSKKEKNSKKYSFYAADPNDLPYSLMGLKSVTGEPLYYDMDESEDIVGLIYNKAKVIHYGTSAFDRQLYTEGNFDVYGLDGRERVCDAGSGDAGSGDETSAHKRDEKEDEKNAGFRKKSKTEYDCSSDIWEPLLALYKEQRSRVCN